MPAPASPSPVGVPEGGGRGSRRAKNVAFLKTTAGEVPETSGKEGLLQEPGAADGEEKGRRTKVTRPEQSPGPQEPGACF